jgi:hypothetical protein
MANDPIGGDRPLRVCDLCGGVDDHPRHVISGAIREVFHPSDGALERVMTEAPETERIRLVRELLDTTSSDRHLDCCRAAGCPDGSCGVMTSGAEDRRGAELLDHLVKVGPERMGLINDVSDIPQQGG